MWVVEFQDVEVDYCPSCRGCWLDDGELGLLLHGDPARRPQLPLRLLANGERGCPRCGDAMRQANIEGTGVTVDTCPRQHGLWLDGGELRRLINAVADRPDLARLSDFCDSVFGAAST